VISLKGKQSSKNKIKNGINSEKVWILLRNFLFYLLCVLFLGMRRKEGGSVFLCLF